MKLYASYGSNMDQRAMSARAPSAKPLLTPGVINDWRLTFAYWPIIEYAPGEKTDVGVWLIDDEAENKLDAYEGYPAYYNKAQIDVRISVSVVPCLCYFMVPEGVTSQVVYNDNAHHMTLQGHKDFVINIERLEDALGRAGQPIDRAAYESAYASLFPTVG